MAYPDNTYPAVLVGQIPAGRTMRLPPGDYRAIQVGPQATALLDSDDYTATRLSVAPGGRIRPGPGADLCDTYVNVDGPLVAARGADLTADLYSRQATLDANVTLTGSVLADTVSVGRDGVLRTGGCNWRTCE